MPPTCQLLHGDSLNVLPELSPDSVDAVITDPPYGLAPLPARKVTGTLQRWLAGETTFVPDGKGFMGEGWDTFVPPPALWAECLRVLKPGGFTLAFCAPRTQDVMAMSMRFAGFEVHGNLLNWVTSQGMPKTADLGREIGKRRPGADAEAWRGWSAGYKNSVEAIIVARKPFRGPLIDNVLTHQVGAFHIDACRVPFASEADRAESEGKNQHADYGTPQGNNKVYGDYTMIGETKKNYDGSTGRWPTDLLLTGGAADLLDSQHPVSRSSRGKPRQGKAGDGWRFTHSGAEYNDLGGPSRFFAKFEFDPVIYCAKAGTAERPEVDGVQHPTCKPLALMQMLVRLVVPPGATILDPCAGSGTTGEAALLEDVNSILVEREAKYLPLIRQRLDRAGRKPAAA